MIVVLTFRWYSWIFLYSILSLSCCIPVITSLRFIVKYFLLDFCICLSLLFINFWSNGGGYLTSSWLGECRLNLIFCMIWSELLSLSILPFSSFLIRIFPYVFYQDNIYQYLHCYFEQRKQSKICDFKCYCFLNL